MQSDWCEIASNPTHPTITTWPPNTLKSGTGQNLHLLQCFLWNTIFYLKKNSLICRKLRIIWPIIAEPSFWSWYGLPSSPHCSFYIHPLTSPHHHCCQEKEATAQDWWWKYRTGSSALMRCSMFMSWSKKINTWIICCSECNDSV